MRGLRTCMLWAVLAFGLDYCIADPAQAADAVRPSRTKEAYVTLLYGDSFLLGVRVLGQSLRQTGTTRDMVVIAAGELSQYAIDTLTKDGWRVKLSDPVKNPNMRDDHQYPTRFWAVYTKLNVFNMIEYEKVVFLDADTIVVNNMDEIFRCPGFCAALRHSERFNSGVMVIQPNTELFEQLISSISAVKSYTGGDQGFLNAYFKGFVDGIVFDPEADYKADSHKYMRLPTRYNADIGLYVFNSNRWQVDGSLKVVHYTLGSFKPWDWWCGWLIEEQARWNRVRMQLPEDAYGRRHGVTSLQLFAQNWLTLVPLLVAAVMVRFVTAGFPARVQHVAAWTPTSWVPDHPPMGASIAAGYLCIVLSLGFAVFIIPSMVTPSWGWILAYEYFFMCALLLFGKWLHFCWHSGRQTHRSGASAPGHLHKVTALPWCQTLLQGGSLSLALIATPWLNLLLQVPGFVPKILLTIVGAILTNTLATCVFASLGDLWFTAGRGDLRQ